MNTHSWVVRHRVTGAVILETYSEAVKDAINTQVYEVVPILRHLQELNTLGSKQRTLATSNYWDEAFQSNTGVTE
jgi:hypothetical protein